MQLITHIDSPGTTERSGRKRAEVPPIGTLRLYDHKPLLLAFELVHLDSLEQVLSSVRHDHSRCGAKAAREVANRHRSTVDATIVTREEQVHVGVISDHGLIDWPVVSTRDGAGEEGVWAGPPARVSLSLTVYVHGHHAYPFAFDGSFDVA